MIAIAMCGTGTAFQVNPVVTRQISSKTGLAAQPTAGTGQGESLQYNPEKYQDEKNKGNYRRLTDALEVSTRRSSGSGGGRVSSVEVEG